MLSSNQSIKYVLGSFRLRTLLSLLIFLGITISSFSQEKTQFRTYTQQDGLSNDFIRQIGQDHQGFLWVGTENGLNRFDGSQFLEFRYDPEDAGSISDNFINHIFEDSRKHLWIATRSGLNLLNRANSRFEQILPLDDEESNDDTQILQIYEDSKKNLWVSSLNKGLFKLILKDEENASSSAAYTIEVPETGLPKNNPVTSFLEDDQGHLWLGTEQGLFSLDLETNTIIQQVMLQKDGLSISLPKVIGMSMDSNRQLWGLSSTEGLFHLQSATAEAKLFPIRSYQEASQERLAPIEEEYHCFLFRGDKILVGTNFASYQVDLSKKTYSRITFIPERASNSTKEIAKSFFLDQQGQLWVGTLGKGLYQETTVSGISQFYQHDPLNSTSISRGAVRTIQEGDPGYLWMGIYRSGIDQFKLNQEGQLIKTRSITAENTATNTLLDNEIIEIIKDQKGSLWIGTNGKGLNQLNPATGQFEAFVHQAENQESLSGNRIWGLCEDDSGFIWVGTFLDGLNRLDPKTGTVKRFLHDPNHLNSLSNNRVKTIFKDREGIIWIGTNSGLNALNPKTEEFQHYFHDSNDLNSLSNSHIWVVFEDQNNDLWIGTSLGLNRFDRQNNRFDRYYENSGLPSNTVYGILEEDNGTIWVSTDNGLARMQPTQTKTSSAATTFSFEAFKKEDGLGTNNFLPKAYYKSPSTQQLFFGSTEGLVVVHPEHFRADTSAHKLVLSSLSKFNLQSEDDKPIIDQFVGDKDRINITHLDRVLTFTLSDLDWNVNSQCRYQYKLDGFSQQWINLDDNLEFTFTNLSPGNYRLMARCESVDDAAQTDITLLQINVAPAWWRSSWARVLYAIGLLSLIIALYRFNLNRQLQMQETTRLQELDDLKNRLYTNITHEFRTPLTVIQGITERIKGHDKERKIIQRNNADLLNLVNQILELQKVESGKLTLNMVQGDIIFYLRYILESFNSLAEDKGIQLHFLSRDRTLVMDYDKEKLLRIISNLLSNGIKFTPKGGNVYLMIDSQTTVREEAGSEAEQSFVVISVRDTGIGIPKEKLPYVFDRFYQASREDYSYQNRDQQIGEGTGIGMALTKELVNFFNGTINIESQVDQGTTFKLRLPIIRQAPKITEDHIPEITSPQPAVLVDTSVQPKEAAVVLEPGLDEMPSLLVIEDNPDIVTYISALLENDYRVHTAPDGQVGIDKALKQIPDIIISDIMMPHKDGFEVCETLKNDDRTSHIPIILLTGKIDVDSRMAGLKRGADAYLTKPFHQEELFIRLEQLLALRRRLQQRYQSPGTLPPSTEPAIQQEDIFMTKVRKTIEKRMKNQDFSTPELSKALGMSRSHLHLKIKALTNSSTSHYIRLIRLQRAKELLENTDDKIADIALKVGFSRPTYFSRLFSEQFGKSPRHFRS